MPVASPTKPAPRRIVLLARDGSVSRILAEPEAHRVRCEMRLLAAQHPGEVVAAEWLSAGMGWVRWITVGGNR